MPLSSIMNNANLYESLFERNRAIILIIDPDTGAILDANPAACDFYIWPRERMRGLAISDINTLTPDEIHDEMQRAKEESRNQFFFKHRRGDGSVRNVEVASGPVDVEGRTLLYSIVHDVTDRVTAQNDLRESEARFRLAIDEAPEAIYMRTGLVFSYVNQKFCDLMGAAGPDELLGTPVLDRYHPDIHEKIRGRMRAVGEEGQSVLPDEERLIRLDGGMIYAEASAVAFTYKETRGSLVFLRDMTERHQAAEALRESEEKYRLLFDGMLDGFALHEIICDDAGTPVNYRFLDINPAFERMTGMSAAYFVGKTVKDALPEIEPVWIERYGRVALTGEACHFEEYSNGLRKHFEVTAYSPRAGKFVTIFNDVTESKRLQEQFAQSQKMETIGRLAGGIAHDFNNLLTVIGGNADMALAGLNPRDPLHHDLAEIKATTDRAANLTRQLLAFSRRQIVEPKVINMNETLYDMDKMLRRLIGEHIQFVTVLAPDLWNVRIDPGQIEQMLTNLVVNARDAMPKGGKITMETSNVDLDEPYTVRHIDVQSGEYVMFAVTDTGIGMDDAILDRIFEPFFTTKEKGKGTGLGLSTCYGVAKQNGGSIFAYSEPGVGTTMKVYLPRVSDQKEHSAATRDLGGMPGGTETILVVEDEPTVNRMTVRILKSKGYTVIGASNGEEALASAARHGLNNIDLLVTDVVMPRMGGKELSEKIRALSPDLKVLFTSGYTDNSIVHHGVLEEGILFMHKPFSPADLLKKVRDVLDM